MSNLSQSVADKINKEQIKQKPVWIFVIQKIFWTILLVLSVVFGGVSVAIIGFLLVEQDWEELQPELANRITPVLLAIPYLWLIIFTGLIFLSWYYFKHLGRCYRQPMFKVAAWVLSLSLVIGLGLLTLGWGERVNNYLASAVPIYSRNFDTRHHVWQRPLAGYISGQIIQLGSNQLRLAALDNKIWLVRLNGDTKIDALAILDLGGQVRVIGYQLAPFDFLAKEIKDWDCVCGGYCERCGGHCAGCEISCQIKESGCGQRKR